MKIYSFIIGKKRSAIHIEPKVNYDDVELTYGPSTLKENNVFIITKGKKRFDALSFTYSVNWVFSENVRKLFEENNITGIEFYPIVIEDLKEKYYGYFVTGKAGKVLNEDKMGCVPMFEPYEFNEEEWDGSDIFCFENSGATYFIEKVKNILEENKITNLEISDHSK